MYNGAGVAAFSREGTNLVKPVLQALVVADRIYEDKATGKKIIVGTFGRVFFKPPVKRDPGQQIQIPSSGMQAGSPFAYVSITDVHEEAKLVIRYVRLDGEPDEQQAAMPLFQTGEMVVKCPDRLAHVELVVPLPPLPAVKGVFALELLSEGELLGSHRIVVEEMK